MDRETFVKQVRRLADHQSIAFKLDDLLRVDVSCDGLLGGLIDSYGDLILTVVSNGREISDKSYEDFWNCVTNSDEWDDEDIEQLYERLARV